MLDEVIRRLLPTPTVPLPKVAPIPSDCEMLIQRLLGVIRPPQPVIQERSQLTDMEIALQNLLPVSSVVEEEGPSSEPIAESLAGCFSCGDWDHETDRCQELDESFPFLPVGWQADRIGDDFLLRPGLTGATDQPGGKRRLIRGEGLVARISNDYGPQLPVVGEDIPGPAVSNYLGAVRSLRMVDKRDPAVCRGVRSPCSDSDESEDDVLSVGPMRPSLFAAPLGGARGHDYDMIQANSLRDEWSVYSWSAEDRYGTSCAQLDNFDWVMPAGYPVGVLPRLEEDDSLSDIEPDVCDVSNVFPIRSETAAVEPLSFLLVVQTRPQGDCDPGWPLLMGKGRDFLAGDEPEVIVSGRKSKIAESDVSHEICVVSDQFPVVAPKLAAVPLAISGAPVLEPLEHSVLEKSLDGGFMEGVPVLELLEHSVLGETPDGDVWWGRQF